MQQCLSGPGFAEASYTLDLSLISGSAPAAPASVAPTRPTCAARPGRRGATRRPGPDRCSGAAASVAEGVLAARADRYRWRGRPALSGLRRSIVSGVSATRALV